MKFVLFIALALIPGSLFARDLPAKASYTEVPRFKVSTSATKPSDIEGLVWNKWETENFIILSIDPEQGWYLVQNVELIKSWLLSRWNLPDVNFSVKCKIVATPDAATLKKLFNFDQPYGEVKRDTQGRIASSSVWISFNSRPLDSLLSSSLTLPVLYEVRGQTQAQFGFWVFRGMNIMNRPTPEIRDMLSRLDQQKKVFSVKDILGMNEAGWLALKPEERPIFDRESAALMLLLRKEMGEFNLLQFLFSPGNEAAIRDKLGYANIAELDGALKRFMTFLAIDIRSNRTPDDYLMIMNAKSRGK